MRQKLIFILFSCLSLNAQINNPNYNYETMKNNIEMKYKNQTPKQWGESVNGVKTHFETNKKVIALTLDACGSPHGMAYDKKLISYLESKNIPATLFINARWIDKNLQTFKTLASKPLFEIANHGHLHKPASVNGRSVYGISGTSNISELIDEIELNAQKIESITNQRPKYFRSGTAYYDEIAVKIAKELNHEVIGFSILGDAGATFNAQKVENALMSAKKGEIVILHMNHPNSGTANGVINAIVKLQEKGFKFVKLSDYPLK